MEEPTTFSVEISGSVVKVTGELDCLTAPKLLQTVLHSTCSTLDLSDVSFIDSQGLQVLVVLRRKRSSVRIRKASAQVQRLLELTDTATYLMSGAHKTGREADPA